MASLRANWSLTQGTWVKSDATRIPSTIFPRILIGGSFLFQCILQFLTSPAVEKGVVDPEDIESSSNRVIDDVIQGLWKKVESRDRGEDHGTRVGCIQHQSEVAP